MKTVRSCQFTLILAGLLLCGSQVAVAQTHSDVPAPPVINSTYVATDPILGQITVHLYENAGQLIRDQKSKDGDYIETVNYENVNYIAIVAESPRPTTDKRTVNIEASDGSEVIVVLSTESEARSVMEYVGRKGGLEFIGNAWRVRKPFQCPNPTGPGCKSFGEMLRREDPDIVEYFYSRPPEIRTYACFDNDSDDFFLLQLSQSPRLKIGIFREEDFHNGQSIGTINGSIQWFPNGAGQIVTYQLELRSGQKAQQFGSTDASSLTFQRTSGGIRYELAVRWSTGRYTETFSEIGNNKTPSQLSSSGLCIRLN